MTTDTISKDGAPKRARRAGMANAATSTTMLSKSDTVIKLLLRARGATSVELIAATEWQPHSVRAFLSGLRKKGRVLVREARKNGELAYRIDSTGKAAVDSTPAAPTPTPAATA